MILSACPSLRWCSLCVTALSVAIVGCGTNLPSDNSVGGGQLRGSIHGGQQPISGASIQLYAAATTGYGAGAVPLLSPPVISDAGGGFVITGGYTCPSSSSQLYIVATGGNPGLTSSTSNNPAITLMAALGPCSLYGSQYTLDPNAFLSINEVTTVASVYALAAFMGGDATHVGTSSTNAIGLSNSFQIVNNLVNTTTGAALAVTSAGNGTAPQAEINTLADILAYCVNSDGTGAPCGALFAAATPSGGTAPTDTIKAIYNIASNPANQVGALYALVPPGPPFQPTLTEIPNDWTVGVNYAGAGPNAQAIAIDGPGNVWIANNGNNANSASITELSNNGMVLSGATGYTGGGMSFPIGIAIDQSGNAWVAAYGNGNVVKLSSSGAILSGPGGFTGGGLSDPRGVAIDGTGNAWVADYGSHSVIKLSSSGAILSGGAGFTAGGSTSPISIAIDNAGNAWVANINDYTVTELSNSGAVLSGTSGYYLGPLVHPNPVAIDGSGNAWVENLNNAVLKLNGSGTLLSPAAGFHTCVATISPQVICDTASTGLAIDGAGNVWTSTAYEYDSNSNPPFIIRSSGVAEVNNSGTILSGGTGYSGGGLYSPRVMAIDGAGNVWVINGDDSVTELIGAATPVVTPFSVGITNHTLGTRP
jgi:hypothetical protein